MAAATQGTKKYPYVRNNDEKEPLKASEIVLGFIMLVAFVTIVVVLAGMYLPVIAKAFGL